MVSIVRKEALTLFPTMVFKGIVSDLAICDRAEQNIYKCQATNIGTTPTAGSFVTSDMLQDNPDFKEIADLVLQETKDVLNYHCVVRDSHYITNMWANITKANERHLMHVHPNSFLSGILYIRTPENCAPTTFNDPRPGAGVIAPDYHTATLSNGGVMNHKATKGEMLIWNSWLPHGVDIGHCDPNDDRIVIAFNVMIKGTSTKPTGRLVF